MSASAGRVLLLFKGAYDPTVTYEKLDVVTYASGSYVCKQTSLNNLPTDTTYWQNMVDVADMTGASAGAAGTHGLVPAPAAGDQAKFLRGDATWAELDLSAKADQSIIGGSYNANTAYTPGDRFTYNGKRYKVTITSGTVQGQTPPNALYYEECSVDDDISSLNSSLTEIMKKAVFIAYNTGTINPELGSVKGISGYSANSLIFNSGYINGVANSGASWYGNYFENPVDLTYFDTLYVKFENVSAITSGTNASYQLMLWNSTPVWNGGYSTTIIMDREGNTYARNYAQGTHIVSIDLSSYTTAQKATTYIGIGAVGNASNSHILQIWAK